MNQMFSSVFFLVIMGALLYFMMIRPQKKQQAKHNDMMSSMKSGDHVITIGRLHGVIDEINEKEKTVVLDCDGIYLTFDLRAIAEVKPGTPKVAPVDEDDQPKEVAAPTPEVEKPAEEVVSDEKEDETK